MLYIKQNIYIMSEIIEIVKVYAKPFDQKINTSIDIYSVADLVLLTAENHQSGFCNSYGLYYDIDADNPKFNLRLGSPIYNTALRQAIEITKFYKDSVYYGAVKVFKTYGINLA